MMISHHSIDAIAVDPTLVTQAVNDISSSAEDVGHVPISRKNSCSQMGYKMRRDRPAPGFDS